MVSQRVQSEWVPRGKLQPSLSVYHGLLYCPADRDRSNIVLVWSARATVIGVPAGARDCVYTQGQTERRPVTHGPLSNSQRTPPIQKDHISYRKMHTGHPLSDRQVKKE
ncbi:hypothetical protein MRX96_002672 [Rhipicephalus microplus]